MEIYVVKPGDTLNSIANQYGVSVERLAYDNEIEGNTLVVGQALFVLFPDTIYTIQNGDTLTSIAEQFNTTALQLVRNNSFLLNEDFLLPGRELVIRYANTENRGIDVFGYAYSYIRQEILEESCLYIQELLPFSYGWKLRNALVMGSVWF